MLDPNTDPTLAALLRLWPTMTPDQREFALFSAQAIATGRLEELWEEVDDILAANMVHAAIAVGKEEVLPLEQAIAEVERATA